MRMERTVREIAGDYAVLENETGGTTEVALALLPNCRSSFSPAVQSVWTPRRYSSCLWQAVKL